MADVVLLCLLFVSLFGVVVCLCVCVVLCFRLLVCCLFPAGVLVVCVFVFCLL